jgi:hypothetical protein
VTTTEVVSLCIAGLSLLGAVVAGIVAYRAYDLNRFQVRLATRNQFQQLLLDFNGDLVRDPDLWCVYDDEHRPPGLIDPDSPRDLARLEAFAYKALNVFQIVHAYTVDSGRRLPGDEEIFQSWVGTMRDFRHGSRFAQAILDRPETNQLYDRRFLDFFRNL